MSYLLERDPYPITPDDIRPLLGIAGRQMDPLIAVGIVMICGMSTAPVRREVWDVPEGIDAARYGTPVAVGDLHRRPGADRRLFRACTYEADPRAIEVARQKIVAWCMRQNDILEAVAAERLAAMKEMRWATG